MIDSCHKCPWNRLREGNGLWMISWCCPGCFMLWTEWCQGLNARYVRLPEWHLVVPLLRWQMLQLHCFRELHKHCFYNAPFLCRKIFSFRLNPVRSFQQPAVNVLKEIQVFLEANPSEVVTIFIEDYVTSPNGLTKVFNASGLMKYWFPVSLMPKNGGDWPLLSDMIRRNLRLLVFTSKRAKEASEAIAYEWKYVVENQCKELTI